NTSRCSARAMPMRWRSTRTTMTMCTTPRAASCICTRGTTTPTIMRTGITAMDDFVLRAFLGGLGLAAVAGPLGALVVWRRMAFFGDALAHSALLGVTLGFALGINLTLGIALLCVLLALLLVTLQNRVRVAADTLLGIFAHSTLSLGLVVIAFMDRLRVDLLGYLFGD